MSRHQPNRHTCPDIDNCIKWLKEARGAIESAIIDLDKIDDSVDSKNDNGIYDLVYSAKHNLKHALDHVEFDGTLNELRDSNSELRDWGYELRAEIEKMENEYA